MKNKAITDTTKAPSQAGQPELVLLACLIAGFCSRIRESYRFFFLIYCGIGALITFLLIRTGPVVIMRFGHDVPVYLDSAWRVLCGQIPHVDFQQVLGALFFLILAAGMKICGVSVWGIVCANILMFWLFSFWAWILAVKRLSAPLAFLFTLAVGLFITGTYHLGFDYTVTTYTTLYNRYGYAMLFIVILELFFPLRKEKKLHESAGGFSTGFLLVCLWFIKINYFTAASLFILLRILLAVPSKDWVKGFMAGFFCAIVPMALYFRFSFSAVVHDYRIVSMVRGYEILMDSALFMEKIGPFAYVFILLPFYMLLFSSFAFTARGGINSPVKLFVIMGVSGFCGILLNMTNYGIHDMPMLLVMAFLPFEYFDLKVDRSKEFKCYLLFPLLLICIFTVGSFYGKNLASIVFAGTNKARMRNSITKIKSETLNTLSVDFADGSYNREYPEKINEGLELLRKHIAEHDRIVSLDFENPFPVGLRLKSPKGFYGMCNFGVDFNNEHYIPPERAFSDTTLIMVPKPGCPESTLPLLRIYGDYMEKHFDFVESTERWMLYRRKP
ncbi:MAG: hypothetical protein RDV48_28040 [Candidatus Eremiobacteraeota bacterium]|nr:hypothetical protein [Candidatus Eremiobacteraeota bacterium]